MKVRNGFVSNSSSSSFIVAFQKDLKGKDKRNVLYEKMGVDKDSFFFLAAKGIADCILSAEKVTIQEYLEYFGYSSLEEYIIDDPLSEQVVRDVFMNPNFEIFMGSATNEGYEFGEALFCDMEWFADDKDFYINKNEGF